MKAIDYIPRKNFNKWYKLFKKSKGRLLCNPIDGNRVYVSYTFDDMNSYRKFCEDYLRLTTNIIETKRCFLKRLKFKFNSLFKIK